MHGLVALHKRNTPKVGALGDARWPKWRLTRSGPMRHRYFFAILQTPKPFY